MQHVILGAGIVDRWWFWVSLTAARVVATIGGVYLAAAIALRHERKRHLAESSALSADALRPILRSIGATLDGVLTLEAEQAVYEMDDDHHVRKDPRIRLRDQLTRAQEDYRVLAGSHVHHLGRLDLALALHNCFSVADGIDTILGALSTTPTLIDTLGEEIKSLRSYVVTVDHAFLNAALGQPYDLPTWSPHCDEQLRTIYETWFD